MKLFLTSVAVYLSLCDASADRELRPNRPSGRGEPGGRLATMIKTECNGDFSCDGVDPDTIDCTFDSKKSDERPNFSGLNSDQQAQLKAELQAKKEERRQNMLQCACCAGMSVEDILAARGDTDGSRPLGGRPGGRPGDMRGEDSSGVDSSGDDSSGDDTSGDDSSGDDSSGGDSSGVSVEDILAARGDTDGSRPLGGRPGGRPGDMRGDDSSGVDSSGDDSSGDDSSGDDSSGDDSSGDDGNGGDSSGGDSSGVDSSGGDRSGGDSSGGSGRPDMGMAGSSRPQQGSGGGSGRPDMGLFVEGSRPQGGGDGGSGRPDDIDIEAMLAEKCDDFLPKCDSLADKNINCSLVDSMSSNTRGGRRRDFLYCGCCDGGGD